MAEYILKIDKDTSNKPQYRLSTMTGHVTKTMCIRIVPDVAVVVVDD